ncbi:uncharacterized protein LOC119739983 [Patiria miniata]|uniref:Integrase catalytic domain-containing protein n=1 Tax=Patiria miniata TaxID=46514 RepID=A0A914B463_PATMI|nr:uncharacterized protein LOC119739983 [Patiria miniata]
MAEALGVSESTIRRRLSEFEIKLGSYCDLSDDALDMTLREVIGHNKNVGSEGARDRLKSRGIKVQRQRVRDAMERVDPAGVALRALHPRLERSVYNVAGPNSLWHIDGNHKLIRYRIIIHGCIDGSSRLLVFLKASSNNLAATVLENFVKAAGEYGMPSRVRMDQGVENGDVSLIMELMRGFGRGSAIRGRSCHNQRIERAWVDVWNGVTNVYHTLFAFLESRQLLGAYSITYQLRPDHVKFGQSCCNNLINNFTTQVPHESHDGLLNSA